jgi:hypothetical protein
MTNLQPFLGIIWTILVALVMIGAGTGALLLRVRVNTARHDKTEKRLDDFDIRVRLLEKADAEYKIHMTDEVATLKSVQLAQTHVLERMENKVDRILEDGCYRAVELHGKQI